MRGGASDRVGRRRQVDVVDVHVRRDQDEEERLAVLDQANVGEIGVVHLRIGVVRRLRRPLEQADDGVGRLVLPDAARVAGGVGDLAALGIGLRPGVVGHGDADGIEVLAQGGVLRGDALVGRMDGDQAIVVGVNPQVACIGSVDVAEDRPVLGTHIGPEGGGPGVLTQHRALTVLVDPVVACQEHQHAPDDHDRRDEEWVSEVATLARGPGDTRLLDRFDLLGRRAGCHSAANGSRRPPG